MQWRLSSSSTVLHFVIVVYFLQNRPPALFLLFKKWDRQRAIEHLHHPPSLLKPLLPSAICWVECTLYNVQPTLVTGSTAQDQISKSYWGHIGAVKAGRSLDCLTSQLQCSIGLLQLLVLVTMDYHKLSSWAGTTLVPVLPPSLQGSTNVMRADNPEEIPVTHYCQGALPSCRSYLVQIGPTNLVIWFIVTYCCLPNITLLLLMRVIWRGT